MDHHVKDMNLADAGKDRIEWADRDMPVLASIRENFEATKPLEGIRVSACLHVTTETANLMRTLKAGGADIVLCASNPLSTQDDVAAALVTHYGVRTYAIKGEDTDSYYAHIDAAIEHRPHITMDDGADVVGRIHAEFPEALEGIIGGTEETTTGVIRLAAMANDDALKYPIVAVNDAMTKHLFDNRYGTGQSTLDGIIRATNRLLAGRTLVVSGYGWCGRGIAMRGSGMGANVVVCEIDPLKALEAVMDGYRVMPAVEAAAICDVWVTVTGDINVIDVAMFEAMKDGAIICNSGHFNVEINTTHLREKATSVREVRPLVEEFVMPDGRTIYLLADGRLVNLACAEGHPANVMDMSFANQALCAQYMVANAADLEPGVYGVPEEIDADIAALKLASMGIKIDELTQEQERYLCSWQEGTV
ncbi:MAG: adenosylhomocysteinase [Actinobacteria bacterium HGW-Actinobacteria-10]|jgi:adenosylhomocysteinase|nr:MAG: adenosylhomocysteinase [Actinobacteria bacterium HGW-Actinobacteria-10]